jgi:hypothetical protein
MVYIRGKCPFAFLCAGRAAACPNCGKTDLREARRREKRTLFMSGPRQMRETARAGRAGRHGAGSRHEGGFTVREDENLRTRHTRRDELPSEDTETFKWLL